MVTWLLEHGVFKSDEKPLIEALERQGIQYHLCHFGESYDDIITKMGSKRAIFHGSLQFGKLIKQTLGHSISVYCNLPKYECVYYYPRFGDYLVNSDYAMLPFGELSRRTSWLFEVFGPDSLFLRPSSGYKTFTGLVLDRGAEWDMELNHLRYRIDPETLVVVAPVRTVDKEWRVVVVDGKVITAGQYRDRGIDVRVNDVPMVVTDFAQQVVGQSGYKPDFAWTLDVGETQRGLRVIEVGSFSCAGLYACDYDAIVKTVQ